MPHHANVYKITFLAMAILFGVHPLAATSVAPITSGPYPVGSTNFEVTSLSTSAMEIRLIGSYTSSGDIYIADILLHPADCPSVTVDMPVNSARFGRHSGKSVKFVAYVFYPTTDDNARADYVFPYTNTGDHTFPHMQKAGDDPILRDAGVRYPLIIFSHGYNAHGLWDLSHVKLLASQGFIVVSIQHGDGRNTFAGCFGERPLAVSKILDYMLADPDFGPAIDNERIGISGSSFGGYTTLAVTGGGCFGSSDVPTDSRFRAGFGIVPYVGGTYGYYPFGSNYSSLGNVECPFFAVYANNDTSVPKSTVEAALPQIEGTCTGVILAGETHSLSESAWVEAKTYEILFFEAWLCDDKNAMNTLYGDMNVDGGVDDRRTYQQVVAQAVIDENSCFGNSPVSWRLRLCGISPKLRVAFPVISDGSYRYDVMGSNDLADWQCLRVTVVDVEASDRLSDLSLPEGFEWRVAETKWSLENLTGATFLRIRVSE